ncbi:MAG: CofH family radical SAM protein, partial [Terriglobales bacterium]
MLAPDWPTSGLQQTIGAASLPVAGALERVLSGRELGFAEAMPLATAEGADLFALVLAADRLRRTAVGDVITYVVNRNLNFTNVCFVGCAFCGFSRGPRSADAYFHSTATLVEKTAAAVARGATEVCIQGGLAHSMPGSYYADLLAAIHGRFPALHIHAFSPMEISYGVDKTGLPLPEYLAGLQQRGLGSIPGTAAEILDDAVRGQLSPNKLAVSRWVEVIRAAHRLSLRSTATMMYGHVENPEHWVRHMLLLRDIQHETGGFTEFVPLGFIHPRTRLYRHGAARAGASWRDHLAVHALARVLF